MIRTFLNFLRAIAPKRKLAWNPIIKGYPRSLKKEYWEHPSKMIGRDFDHFDGRYQVVDWRPRGPSYRDFDEDDGVIVAVRISKNVAGERK
jgi:hypothetical protein